jgi:hypothetical protein
MSNWSSFYHRPHNHRWSSVDRHVLEVVADAMGWGPERLLLEIGGGRGTHSKRLWQMGRCETAHVYDTCPDSRLVAERHGMPVVDELREAHIVWSYGVVEHLDGLERQDIIDQHFKYAAELVVIVVPRKSRTRAKSPSSVPWWRGYTKSELVRRMERPGWSVEADSFAPLYGIRHIPDAFYEPLTTLAKHILPGNLLIGVARREK